MLLRHPNTPKNVNTLKYIIQGGRLENIDGFRYTVDIKHHENRYSSKIP